MNDEFNILALIEAGHIKADDDTLGIIQGITSEHAHAIGKWLALATNGPIDLRLIGFHGAEEIHYTPTEVRADIARRQQQRLDAENAGASDAET